MMKLIYNIFIFIYFAAINIASLFNGKAKQWVAGRRNIFSKIGEELLSNKQIIWVHSASLGEFEQARPIIEQLKVTYPDYSIFLTFFSPSGFEVRKDYKYADYVYYLPLDTAKNARHFIKMLNPKLVIFVKYEFWFNYIDELYRRKIPLIFVSVIFRPSQHFFKPWGRWFAWQLNRVTYLFVQNEDSLKLLDGINVHHAEVSGDTRFDRVSQLPNEEVSFPIMQEFKANTKLLVAGSTWQPGEIILCDLLINSTVDFKLVIAPHMINKEHISEIVKRFQKYNPILFSNASSKELIKSRVLIIDSIGILSHLYRYADIAYIGGGFGVGIHNLLEASTYGIPVLFGPNYKRFREAVELYNNGGGYSIVNSGDFLVSFENLMTNDKAYKKSANTARNYVIENSGATHLIVDKVRGYLS